MSIINTKKTFNQFGYYPYSLRPSSHKRVIVNCNLCGNERETDFLYSHKPCYKCSIKNPQLNNRIKQVDLEGQIFGRLTVVKCIKKLKNRDHLYECRCECGNIRHIASGHLKNGHTISCGCKRIEVMRETGKNRTIGNGIAAKNNRLRIYKRGAVLRNIKWDLSNSDFFEIVSKDCHYCGDPPSNFLNEKTFNGKFICNGIDRIDSSIGYILYNCVPCCKNCNYAKRKMSYNEFISLIKRIYVFRVKVNE